MTQPIDGQPSDVVRLPVTGVRREVLDALHALSATTGLSVSWLIRSVIEQHLSGVGLLTPTESTPPLEGRTDGSERHKHALQVPAARRQPRNGTTNAQRAGSLARRGLARARRADRTNGGNAPTAANDAPTFVSPPGTEHATKTPAAPAEGPGLTCQTATPPRSPTSAPTASKPSPHGRCVPEHQDREGRAGPASTATSTSAYASSTTPSRTRPNRVAAQIKALDETGRGGAQDACAPSSTISLRTIEVDMGGLVASGPCVRPDPRAHRASGRSCRGPT